jgi:hypothetical protein
MNQLPPTNQGQNNQNNGETPVNFWDADEMEADKMLIDKTTLKPEICLKGEHQMEYDFAGRDAKCRKCGLGYRFVPDKVIFKEGNLYSLSGEQLF